MYIISNGGLSSCNIPDTMDAIMLTKNVSYIDGVKIDVRESLDKKIVLSKYEELEKLTLAKGLISNYPYDYLKKVHFPSHIFKYFIPSIEDVLNHYNPNKIVVLELFLQKDSNTYLENVFKIISRYSYQYVFLVDEEI